MYKIQSCDDSLLLQALVFWRHWQLPACQA